MRRASKGLAWVSRRAVLGLALILAACGSAPKPDPKPLQPIASPIAGRLVWTHNVGPVSFPLSVAPSRDRVALVDDQGLISILNVANGQPVWQWSLAEPIGAGVGFDGQTAAVVSRKGEVVAVRSGGVLWRQSIGVQVVTAPLVAGERVFVLASDRSVHAFDAVDGRRLWVFRRPGDPLTLLQTGLLRTFGDTLVVGNGPRMVGLDPLMGTALWETALTYPRGTNEIERLADLVGPSVRQGNLLCARAFQAAIGCIDAKSNALVWNKNVGGTRGIAADRERLYVADASDRISAWSLSDGASVWSRDDLTYHGLSAPAVAGSSLVFGDQAGLVHFLSIRDGRALLRLETDGSPVVAAPVVQDTTVIVVTRRGGVFAMRPELP